jgi:FkbM family methyltransferase
MKFNEYIRIPLPFEAELRRYFRPDDPLVIFDIGSCEAEDSIRLKQRFPNASVYAFEPLRRNVLAMQRNLTRFAMSDVVVIPVALSDRDGTATFHVSSGRPDHIPGGGDWDYGNKSSSLLPPARTTEELPWLKFEETIAVETLRLDTFCSSRSISSVDLAYIDVQGAELLVLDGAGDYLDRIGMIGMEVEAVELYAGQPLQDDVERFMAGRGFRRLKDTVDAIAGDQLYVNGSLLQLPLVTRIASRLRSR